MPEKEKVIKIKGLSDEIVRKVLHDGYTPDASSLKNVVELLSRSVYDLSEMYLNDQCNHEETLKGTLAKMKIACNSIENNQKNPAKYM
ncbi:hypothetical protein [Bacillus sp. UMB0893]|uniref:hypothetical protein n=1 Tax=Bacillus sp. UMB0893 TaxID=2066053 RepID=UPI000C758234|nr:hypothetical protein [Bacillus sp. UMB0893]PLR69451.1 hypothetical protein CYJ36_03130 [Bacillus sp. UMB0893]